MRMNKVIVLLGLMLISLGAHSAGNVSNSWVTTYNTTIKKLEIWNSTTSQWLVLSETSKTVNIASVSAGAEIGSMVDAGLSLPYGTYTKARVTVDDEFTVAACGSSGANCLTGAAASGTIAAATNAGTVTATSFNFLIDFSTDVTSANLSANNATAISGGVEIQYTFTAPFELDATTTSLSIDIAFDLNNVFYFDSGSNYINIDFPKVTITVQ